MFKKRGINHESQAITTTEAWLHYLSVQFQTRRSETFYKQANKYLTLSGYLCSTRRLIPQKTNDDYQEVLWQTYQKFPQHFPHFHRRLPLHQAHAESLARKN